eukprot:scaffold219441_cov14-Prasinocladus_malaysianus.AAC.1
MVEPGLAVRDGLQMHLRGIICTYNAEAAIYATNHTDSQQTNPEVASEDYMGRNPVLYKAR